MPRLVSKANEYRANAEECRRMADSTKNALQKDMWCDMSESWLGMIGHAEREDFATEEREHGTKQPQSKSSH
jgi:hypothetical protein